MSYKIEKSEKNMAKLTIEASAEELDKAIEEAYQKQKKDISIPGFRKGKVPRQMVEQMLIGIADGAAQRAVGGDRPAPGARSRGRRG